jgi:hypothetical protein
MHECLEPIGAGQTILGVMSAMGQKQTLRHVLAMSALPPKADIVQYDRDVRFVAKADSQTASVDKNFKFEAVQQLRPVTCINFRLFHFCHALVNSSSLPREKTNKSCRPSRIRRIMIVQGDGP